MGPVLFTIEWSRNLPAGSVGPFRKEITEGNKPAPWTSANCFFLALMLWCTYYLKPLQTNMRKGTYNYKQVSELTLALTALWICTCPLFKAANNYK